MRQRTSIAITITTAILLAVVFFLHGKPSPHPDTLVTETIPADEQHYIDQAVKLVQTKISNLDNAATMPKHHACVAGVFQVVSNLDTNLQTPLMQPGAIYPAWLRFSNHEEAGPDTKPALRELAVKLFQVEGEKFTGNEATHDFLFASHPVFMFDDVETYTHGLKAFDRNQALRFFFNPLRPELKAYRIRKAMRRNHRDLLAMTWWSMVPFKYGIERAVKYSLRPCSSNAARKRNYGDGINENFLRERLQKSLASDAACFEFSVQFQSDPKTMPIEDPTIAWDETIAPFQPLARLNIPVQSFDNEQQKEFCEKLSFNPWRALPDHQPLGGINRARRDIYAQLAKSHGRRDGTDPAAPNLAIPR